MDFFSRGYDFFLSFHLQYEVCLSADSQLYPTYRSQFRYTGPQHPPAPTPGTVDNYTFLRHTGERLRFAL